MIKSSSNQNEHKLKEYNLANDKYMVIKGMRGEVKRYIPKLTSNLKENMFHFNIFTDFCNDVVKLLTEKKLFSLSKNLELGENGKLFTTLQSESVYMSNFTYLIMTIRELFFSELVCEIIDLYNTYLLDVA